MIGLLTLKSWLENNHPFLTEEDLGFFHSHLVEKTISKEEIVLHAGSTCRDLSFIVSGVFRMYSTVDGKEVNLHFYAENEFMADYGSLLRQLPGRYSIQALESSRVVSFSYEVLQEAYDRSKNWDRFGRLMAEQFACIISGRLEKFLFLDGMGRYVALMQDDPGIFDRVPLYHLASFLGMERETFSRIRQRLSKG
jgi:CRP-like cAMP-binding protein